MSELKPRSPAPDLSIDTLSSGLWKLDEQKPEHFTMLVFYRGLHCPVCSKYLGELDGKLDKFAGQGVNAIAVSCDERERGVEARQDWGLSNLNIGYGLSIRTARDWGLFISRRIKDEEPREFCEPGLFLVKPDRTLFYSAINSMPFGRPQFDEILGGINFVVNKNYPARGEG